MQARRTSALLQTYPAVRNLVGPDWRSKYICTALIGAQFALSLITPALSWPTYLFIAYVLGATIVQALFLAIHELAHDLFFHQGFMNRAFSVFANTPLLIPFALDFRHYHLRHHSHTGIEGQDTDLPSQFEKHIVRSPLRNL